MTFEIDVMTSTLTLLLRQPFWTVSLTRLVWYTCILFFLQLLCRDRRLDLCTKLPTCITGMTVYSMLTVRLHLLIHNIVTTPTISRFSVVWKTKKIADMSLQRAALWISRYGFDFRHPLIACGPSDDKEVKDVFGRPGARVGLCSAR